MAGGTSRAAALCLGLGMLSFAPGNVAYVGSIPFQVEPPVPSLADVGYRGLYGWRSGCSSSAPPTRFTRSASRPANIAGRSWTCCGAAGMTVMALAL